MSPVTRPSLVVRASAGLFAAFLVAASCSQTATPQPSQPVGAGVGGIAELGTGANTAVLFNGKISTLDSKNTVAEALAIRDGKVLAIGTNDEVKKAAGSGAQQVDLKGRTVVPGLIDGTLHGVRNGADCFLNDVRLDQVFNRENALSAYSTKARTVSAGTWLFTWSGWNPNQLDRPGMLTRAELDGALPNNPVMVQATGFSGIQVNSKALQALSITAASTDPGVAKDPQGQPTGQLSGTAAAAARAEMGKQLRGMSIDQQVACLKSFMTETNRVGLTSWDDPAGNDQFDPQGRSLELLVDSHGFQAINQIHRDGEMTARIVLHFSCFTTAPAMDCVTRFTQSAVSLVGDDWLLIGGMGEELTTAMVNGLYPMPDYQNAVDYLAVNRWNLEHHASTAAQQIEVTAAWEAANKKASIKDLGWRMLHPGGGPENPTDDILKRLKALNAGVILTNSGGQGQLAAQPPPYKRAYDSGARMCLGTDALNVSPYPPMWNMWYTVSGHSADPAVPGVPENQRLSREQALRASTVNCAWFMHMEGKIGTLQPGYYADLAVLDKDYWTVPVDDIRTITSVLTITGGKVGWASAEFANLAPKK
jgi:predicted amidohydrolase YtcJ